MTASFGGCAACAGECCRRYLVPLTATDVRSIAAATALHPREFVDLREIALGVPGFRLVGGGPELHLVLDKRYAGQDAAATGSPCIFLMELPNGKARCGIYAARPSACRTFPTTLVHGTAAVRPNIPCGQAAWNVGVMDLPRFRRDLKAQRVAWQSHAGLAADWNAMASGRVRARA